MPRERSPPAIGTQSRFGPTRLLRALAVLGFVSCRLELVLGLLEPRLCPHGVLAEGGVVF